MPAAARTPTTTRIDADDADYRLLHQQTVAALQASVRELVDDLRTLPEPQHSQAQSAFITRHTALLRAAYAAGFTEGAADYYEQVSATPQRWAAATPLANGRLAAHLGFFAPSVAKMAREAALAWRASQRPSGAVSGLSATDRGIQLGYTEAAFDPGQHPRGYHGKFIPAGGGAKSASGNSHLAAGHHADGEHGHGGSGAGQTPKATSAEHAERIARLQQKVADHERAKATLAKIIGSKDATEVMRTTAHDEYGYHAKAAQAAQAELDAMHAAPGGGPREGGAHAAAAPGGLTHEQQAQIKELQAQVAKHAAGKAAAAKVMLDPTAEHHAQQNASDTHTYHSKAQAAAQAKLDALQAVAHGVEHAASGEQAPTASTHADAREAYVAARKAALDGEMRAAVKAAGLPHDLTEPGKELLAAQGLVNRLYDEYPELRAAVTAHLNGGDVDTTGGSPHLSPRSVAYQAANSALTLEQYLNGQIAKPTPEQVDRAKEALGKLAKVSEWSLLHAPGVNARGEITLYHGANGADRNRWTPRLARGLERGTPFTDLRTIAVNFAHGGLIIKAQVPVEAITLWHGIRTDGTFDGEREYTVGAHAPAVPITDYRFEALPGSEAAQLAGQLTEAGDGGMTLGWTQASFNPALHPHGADGRWETTTGGARATSGNAPLAAAHHDAGGGQHQGSGAGQGGGKADWEKAIDAHNAAKLDALKVLKNPYASDDAKLVARAAYQQHDKAVDTITHDALHGKAQAAAGQGGVTEAALKQSIAEHQAAKEAAQKLLLSGHASADEKEQANDAYGAHEDAETAAQAHLDALQRLNSGHAAALAKGHDAYLAELADLQRQIDEHTTGYLTANAIVAFPERHTPDEHAAAAADAAAHYVRVTELQQQKRDLATAHGTPGDGHFILSASSHVAQIDDPKTQAARIAQVKARRAELDAKFAARLAGRESAGVELNAKYMTDRIMAEYPELKAAVEQHVIGGHYVSLEHVLAQHGAGPLTERQIADAKEGLQKLAEVSEWSLLHHPDTAIDGKITLYHGANGHDMQKWSTRLEAGLQRGTPWTNDRGVATGLFAEEGLMVKARVPVEAVTTWYGANKLLFQGEHEFIVGGHTPAVPITEYAFRTRPLYGATTGAKEWDKPDPPNQLHAVERGLTLGGGGFTSASFDPALHPHGYHGHWEETTGGAKPDSGGGKRAAAGAPHGAEALFGNKGGSGAGEELSGRAKQVAARTAYLDAQHGHALKAAGIPLTAESVRAHASRLVAQLYQSAPGLRAAVTEHLQGDRVASGQGKAVATLSPELVAKGNGGNLAAAKAALGQMREISEWSLLHQPGTDKEGMVTLYHGANGDDTKTWGKRLEGGLERGTPFTDDKRVGYSFAMRGLLIRARVPAEAITTWHGIRNDGRYSKEREYTVAGTGGKAAAIKDYSFVRTAHGANIPATPHDVTDPEIDALGAQEVVT